MSLLDLTRLCRATAGHPTGISRRRRPLRCAVWLPPLAIPKSSSRYRAPAPIVEGIRRDADGRGELVAGQFMPDRPRGAQFEDELAESVAITATRPVCFDGVRVGEDEVPDGAGDGEGGIWGSLTRGAPRPPAERPDDVLDAAKHLVGL